MSVDFATNHISGMSTAKATGLDRISVKLLKLTSDAIVDILTYVLNFSIETINFENDWTRAVSPIFKTGEEHMVNNYHTLQPAIWTTDAIGNSDHIYVTRNDR